tara:strand:+ start:15090 stop:15806 length:717 start_codon:yes stop_codon:yes gene_type:complete
MNGLGKVLAIIPARGGSKEVPRKNIRYAGGKPLIAYSIETALELKNIFSEIIVSTDDEEIKIISEKYGAKVPFLRPKKISMDETPMVPVLQHAVNYYESFSRQKIDWICLLQPTNPLRTKNHILNSLELASKKNTDSVISFVRVKSHHPMLMKKIINDYIEPYVIKEEEGTRRQDLKPDAYMRNGAIYLTKRNVLMKDSSIWGKKITPIIMSEKTSISIDSELDFKIVDELLNEIHQS